MPRHDPLLRVHRLLQLLEAARHGLTLAEMRRDLVERLGLTDISERTVRRDLEALQIAGYPISPRTTPRGTAWAAEGELRRPPPVAATCSELLALSVGRDLLAPLAGTPIGRGIESFWKKVEAAVSIPVFKHFLRQRGSLHVRSTPAKSYARHRRLIATVNRAILEHRVLEIDYSSLGDTRPTHREVAPYALVLHQGSLYLVAGVPGAPPREAIRHFKIDRIQKAKALDRRFRPRSDFCADQHFAESVGVFHADRPQEYRIWVSAYAAPWVIEDPWRADQRITRRKNGDVILTVRAAHDLEIIPRVLALGVEAEVLSPPSCRRAVARIAFGLARSYAAR